MIVIVIGAAYWIIRPAPPTTITIAGGPSGSSFRTTAEKYRKLADQVPHLSLVRGILIALERSMLAEAGPEARQRLLQELDEVEAGVNRMKVPLAYSEQHYVLRDHIVFVRDRYREAEK